MSDLPLHELARRADAQFDALSAALIHKGDCHNDAENTAALVQNTGDALTRFVAEVRTDFPYADPDLGEMLAEVLADALGMPASPVALIKAQMAWRAARDAVASGQMRAA